MKSQKNMDIVKNGFTTTTSIHYPIKNGYSLPIESIFDSLKSDAEKGLNEIGIAKRINSYGLNKYEARKQKSIFLLLIEQFTSPIVLLLVLAAGVSLSF